MRHAWLAVGVALILGCQSRDTSRERPQADGARQPAPDSTQVVVNTPVDTFAELTAFTRGLYKWVETANTNHDFWPRKGDTQDTSFVGIDWDSHTKRMKELEATNFFSDQFLENYGKIAKAIDKELSTGSTTWLVGDMSEYGNDANPWCNCQDYPFNNYWDSIAVVDVGMKAGRVTYKWNWCPTSPHGYELGVSRRGSGWKVDCMQGFDYDAFLHTKK